MPIWEKIGCAIKGRLKNVRNAIRSRMQCWRLRGRRFHCSICGRNFRNFLPSDGMYSIRGHLVDHHTANSVCPWCGSSVRHRFIFSFLQQTLPSWPEGMQVLHFAPEPTFASFFKKKVAGGYFPCDLVADPGLGIRTIDLTATGLSANRFDLVICIHVLEHIAQDCRAIAELYRVLKPWGHALVAVPIYGTVTYEDPGLDFAGRERMFGIGDHVRLNGLDLENKLAAAGFEVQLHSTDNVPGNYLDRTDPSPHIATDKYLFWCRKPLIDSSLPRCGSESRGPAGTMEK